MSFALKYKKVFAISFWLWLAIILFITLVPQSHKVIKTNSNSFFRLDYTIHFFVYFSLSVLFIFWRINQWFRISTKELIWYVLAGIAVCSITELLQLYIPGRTFNKIDLLFNIFGILTGIISTKLLLLKIN